LKIVTGEFNDSFTPILDGVANVVKNYAYWLNKKYGKSYVITPNFPNYRDNEQFQVLRYFSIPLPTRNPYRYGIPGLDKAFLKQLYQIPFDIVHAHSPFTAGNIALNIARNQNIPIIASFHSKFYDDFKAVLKNEFLTKMILNRIIHFFNSVDYVWTVNESTKKTLYSYGYQGSVEVVHNGTDFTIPVNLEQDLLMINKLFNITADELVFLFVGQHILQKNVFMLIKSLKILKDKNIKFKMIFVGTGNAKDTMQTLVKNYKLKYDVYFTGLIYKKNLLKALFSRANLFLFPSIYDNAPLVVIEAAAMGCPSLLIKNSNAAEGIIDNYNGFLSFDNAELYSRRIIELIENKEKLKTVGATAKKTICKSWENIVDEVYKKYLEIIKKHKKGKNTKIILF
jgi:glycosyltransferase involved in cell wall biosynthesis